MVSPSNGCRVRMRLANLARQVFVQIFNPVGVKNLEWHVNTCINPAISIMC